MDALNRLLLDRLQRSFPLVPEPFRALSEELGADGREIMARVDWLKNKRLVRQISAIFNTGALGYKSSLVAMSVPEEELERAAVVISSYPGVSHNYLRPGAYNLWFTIAVPPGRPLEEETSGLAAAAGGWPVLILPALKKYKLAVVLDVLEEGDWDPGEEKADLPLVESSVTFLQTDENVRIVRCVQEDLPVVERPFKVWADELGMAEEFLLDIITRWLGYGFMRRFAALLNHRQAGFSANGMVVWNCPADRIDACGLVLASHSEVSHCYHRPAYPEWPYNLYAMVHGRSNEECRKMAENLGRAIDLHDYRIFFSTREFKKTRLKLFWN